MTPKSSQEHPWSSQIGTWGPHKRPKMSLRGPKSVPGAPRYRFGTLWGAFRTIIGSHFGVVCYTPRRCVALEKESREI